MIRYGLQCTHCHKLLDERAPIEVEAAKYGIISDENIVILEAKDSSRHKHGHLFEGGGVPEIVIVDSDSGTQVGKTVKGYLPPADLFKALGL